MPRWSAPSGHLPTIAHDRAHGTPGVLVYCQGKHFRCPHSAKVDWATIDLPDDTPIIHIPRYRTFRCTVCGTRGQVEIRSDWPDPMEQRYREVMGMEKKDG